MCWIMCKKRFSKDGLVYDDNDNKVNLEGEFAT